MHPVFSTDDEILSSAGFCLADGSRVYGHPASWKRHTLDVEEEWLAEDVDWQQELLAAVGGDKNTLTLLQKLHDGKISPAAFAEELRLNRSTIHKKVRRLRARARITLIARAALRGLNRDGGCTVGTNARLLGPVDAYVVSLDGAEQRFRVVPPVAKIERYIRRHKSKLFHSRNAFLGGWHDRTRKLWILDISIVVRHREDAELLGRVNKQRCIYHMKTRQEIWIESAPSIEAAVSPAL